MLELLLEFLADIFLQLVGELVLEVIFRGGDHATHGRIRRVLVFAMVGFGVGVGSHFVRPGYLVVDPTLRVVSVAASALVVGLALGAVEAWILRGGKGSALGGFLTGFGFSLAYAAGRHLMMG